MAAVQISAAIAEVLKGKLKVDPSRFYLKVRKGLQPARVRDLVSKIVYLQGGCAVSCIYTVPW